MEATTDDGTGAQMRRSILDDAVAASLHRRRAEADEVFHALRYAEACAAIEPSDDSREAMTQIASAGTPEVPEFCHLEYAARLGMRPESGFSALVVALDLAHRLPELLALVDTLSMPVWVARKVAFATRELSWEQARGVSVKLQKEWPRLSPSAFLATAKALVLAITAPQRLTDEEQALASRFVWIRQEEHFADVYARVSKADGLFLEAQLNRLATELGRAGDDSSRDVRRSKALGLLSSPARSLQLLQGAVARGRENEAADELPLGLEDEEQRECPSRGLRGHVCGQVTTDPELLLPKVELVVHLSEESIKDEAGATVVRTSHCGAQLAQTVKQWLGHTRVTVRPVLDTASIMPTSAYEVPGRMRELMDLRNPTSVFPYSTRISRRLDQDHTKPWSTSGPPGQTRPDNLGPLSRREHRAKTFGGWQVTQSQGVFAWVSPLGYRYERHSDATWFDGTNETSRAEAMLMRILRT